MKTIDSTDAQKYRTLSTGRIRKAPVSYSPSHDVKRLRKKAKKSAEVKIIDSTNVQKNNRLSTRRISKASVAVESVVYSPSPDVESTIIKTEGLIENQVAKHLPEKAKCKRLKNVTLILVCTKAIYRDALLPCKSMFRKLLPRLVQCTKIVDVSARNREMVRMYVSRSLSLIKDKIEEERFLKPDDHIFLVGWGVSCLLNHKAISTVSGISGIIDFAFPLECALGARGDVEDEICINYCPSLFIVGENATDSSSNSMKALRRNMIVDTGLIVVGSANNNLLVSDLRLNLEKITQKCVNWSIVQHVTDFINVVIEDNPNRYDLMPVRVPNMFDIDVSVMKKKADVSLKKKYVEIPTEQWIIDGQQEKVTTAEEVYMNDDEEEEQAAVSSLNSLI